MGLWSITKYPGHLKKLRLELNECWAQYNLDRHGRITNNTEYLYYENGEAGNYNKYSSIIKVGNVSTTYTYSLYDSPNKYEVLESLLTETLDGFTQKSQFSYDDKRRKMMDEVYKLIN